jgi:hypothetical protein
LIVDLKRRAGLLSEIKNQTSTINHPPGLAVSRKMGKLMPWQ